MKRKGLLFLMLLFAELVSSSNQQRAGEMEIRQKGVSNSQCTWVNREWQTGGVERGLRREAEERGKKKKSIKSSNMNCALKWLLKSHQGSDWEVKCSGERGMPTSMCPSTTLAQSLDFHTHGTHCVEPSALTERYSYPRSMCLSSSFLLWLHFLFFFWRIHVKLFFTV